MRGGGGGGGGRNGDHAFDGLPDSQAKKMGAAHAQVCVRRGGGQVDFLNPFHVSFFFKKKYCFIL